MGDPYAMDLKEAADIVRSEFGMEMAAKREAERIQLDGTKLHEFGFPLTPPGEDWSRATDEECKQAALDWANMVRGEYNLEPLDELPKGHIGHVSACVLAEAMGDVADGSCAVPPAERQSLGAPEFTFARDGGIRTMAVPRLVNEFIIRFDSGDYPELVRPMFDRPGVFVTEV